MAAITERLWDAYYRPEEFTKLLDQLHVDDVQKFYELVDWFENNVDEISETIKCSHPSRQINFVTSVNHHWKSVSETGIDLYQTEILFPTLEKLLSYKFKLAIDLDYIWADTPTKYVFEVNIQFEHSYSF